MLPFILLGILLGLFIGFNIGYSLCRKDIVDKSFSSKVNDKNFEIRSGKRFANIKVENIGVDE